MNPKQFWFRAFIAFTLFWSATACSSRSGLEDSVPLNQGQVGQAFPDGGVVTEKIDGGKYSFVCVNSGTTSIWLATNPVDVQVGDEIAYQGALVMKDFRSASLNRTFPVILFVNEVRINRTGSTSARRTGDLPSGHPLVPPEAAAIAQSKLLEPPLPGSLPLAPGGLTIGQLFEKQQQLAGQRVRVMGKVVKVNANIMGKNWIHLQDGTGQDGANDLVVTSTQVVEPGAVMIAEGVLVVGKTVEQGYFFSVLLEDASLVPGSPALPG